MCKDRAKLNRVKTELRERSRMLFAEKVLIVCIIITLLLMVCMYAGIV